MRTLFLGLVTFLLLTSSVLCQDEYKKVSGELHAVYQHFLKRSLTTAIEEFKLQSSSAVALTDNVVVRFNGGGSNSKLFIGEKNTLEILVANDAIIGGLSLGLKFECPSTQFSMVQDYGEMPTFGTGPLRVLRMHREPFGTDSSWQVSANTKASNDSILIGGVTFDPQAGLPPQTSPRLLYSLQIELPATATPVSDGFAVRSIFYPPVGSWTFSERQGSIDVAYSPHFQGNPNPDGANPTAPAVYFDIVEPSCYQHHRAQAGTYELSTRRDYSKILDRVVRRMDSDGIPFVKTIIKYNGNLDDLRSLGAEMSTIANSQYPQSVTFKLDLLPKLAAMPLLEYMYIAGKMVEQRE